MLSSMKKKEGWLKPGIIFINILRADFTRANPKSIKIQSNCQYLFALLGSVHVKVMRKMLVNSRHEFVSD